MERKRYVLIVYDVTLTKRRNDLVKVLEEYGVRIQKSVFEAHLGETKYLEMIERCTKKIDTSCDSLCFYILDKYSSVHSFGVARINVDDIECIVI